VRGHEPRAALAHSEHRKFLLHCRVCFGKADFSML
jgi:hypothetical protein